MLCYAMLWQFNTFAQQPKWVVNNSVVDLFTSTATPNAILVPSKLTEHHWPIVGQQYMPFLLYQLPDQQDGEDLSRNFPMDQFPEIIHVCNFPFQLNSTIYANWWYTYANENDELVTAGLGNGLIATMPQSGVLYLSYQSNGCEVVEEVQIIEDPIVTHGADFTYSTNVSSGIMSISANALATNGVTSSWELYKQVSEAWILFATSVVISPNFNSLDANSNFQLKHLISTNPTISCKFNNTITKQIR